LTHSTEELSSQLPLESIPKQSYPFFDLNNM